MNTKQLSALAFISAAGFLAGCGTTSKGVKIDHPVHSPLTPQVVNDFRIHTTPPRAGIPTVTLDSGPDLPLLPDGANKYKVTLPGPITPGTHVLRAVTTMTPSQAFDMTSDEVTFIAARFTFQEVTPTGPSRTVPPGATPTPPGGRSPGPGGFIVRVTDSKTLLIGVPAGLTQAVTATVTASPNVSVTGVAAFSPSVSRATFTVTGLAAGPFTITVEAPGFQTTSFAGTVVP